MNSNFNPPPNPSADAIQAAFALLAVAADPRGAKQRLDALAKAHADITTAHSELHAERERLIDENARSKDLREKEILVAAKQSEQQRTALQQANSSEAQAERDRTLSKRSADLDARERAINEREAAHVRRIEQARAALG